MGPNTAGVVWEMEGHRSWLCPLRFFSESYQMKQFGTCRTTVTPWISTHPAAARSRSMHQHSVPTRVGTVIESEVKTTCPLESDSVMAPQGA